MAFGRGSFLYCSSKIKITKSLINPQQKITRKGRFHQVRSLASRVAVAGVGAGGFLATLPWLGSGLLRPPSWAGPSYWPAAPMAIPWASVSCRVGWLNPCRTLGSWVT